MSGMTANFLTLNSSKTEFLLIGLSKQLAKINNSSLYTTHSARNLGFIFDEHLTFSGKISSVTKSCYYHIRQLHCIRLYLDSNKASTIATSIVHSRLDYCNSLYHNLPKSLITRLQQIQNSLAHAVVKAPKSSHIAPILRSLHWRKITERIEYKLLSRTHTHTHPFNGPFSGTTQVSRYQKGKTNLDFTAARDSEWQWHQLGHMQICISLQTDNHASTPLLCY